jgi:N-acetylglucosamine-6-phosphate deacetylase
MFPEIRAPQERWSRYLMEAIFADTIYIPNRRIYSRYVVYENGLIKDITDEKPDCQIHDFSGFAVIPGLIDIHIHGISGKDTMDATPEALQEISLSLAKHGVTSFLPTTLTDDFEKVKAAVREIGRQIGKTAGAEIIGSYVEGPYITPEHRGAHPLKFMREITMEELDELIKASQNTIKILTLAPEKAMALEVIPYLKDKGILISMGHTNADYETANLAIEKGASISVHTFNGMRGFSHRDPGCLGAFLTDDETFCELIADLEHVHPAGIHLLYKAKGADKILLISDSMAAADLTDGEYKLGSLSVTVKGGIARTLETGSLAGSTTNLMRCLKNTQEVLGLPLECILPMATINQANLLGIGEETGTIEIGKKLNAAVIDDAFNVKATFVNGKVVFMEEKRKWAIIEL